MSDFIVSVPSVIFIKGFLGKVPVNLMKNLTIMLPVSDFFKTVVVL